MNTNEPQSCGKIAMVASIAELIFSLVSMGYMLKCLFYDTDIPAALLCSVAVAMQSFCTCMQNHCIMQDINNKFYDEPYPTPKPRKIVWIFDILAIAITLGYKSYALTIIITAILVSDIAQYIDDRYCVKHSREITPETNISQEN